VSEYPSWNEGGNDGVDDKSEEMEGIAINRQTFLQIVPRL